MRYPRNRASTTSSSESLTFEKQKKDARMRVYSCVFCEFIQTNLFEIESEENDCTIDRAYEAKYLFHLRTVHGLEK